MTTNLRGILAPALTAVTDDFQIQQERTIAHYEWLLENGCDGLLVCGTTSEANSFPVAERKRLLEQAVEAGIDPKRLLVGTGCCAFADSSARLTSESSKVANNCPWRTCVPSSKKTPVTRPVILAAMVARLRGVT